MSTVTKVGRARGVRNPYATRVRRGAWLLDVVWPRWAWHVADDELSMATCDRCLLGQLYASYYFGYAFINAQLPATFLFSAAEHGFTLHDWEQRQEFDEAFHVTNKAAILARFAVLADAWRDEIAARLGAHTEVFEDDGQVE